MVGAWSGWIAAVIRGYEKYVVVLHNGHYFRKFAVKIHYGFRIALYVVPVAVDHIGINKVRKEKTLKIFL